VNEINVLWSILIPALSGLIAGVIGSLVAPYVHWGIEKKREKLKARRDVIQRCRLLLTEFNKNVFCNTQEYRYIKRFLSSDDVKSIESGTMTLPISPEPIKQKILEAIEKLEQYWDLI